ncbi:MAG: PIN domain-containing protein [Steroidobacteraceae bacterium]
MIVDASVWVAVFRANDSHHADGIAFLEAALARLEDLHVPNLALAEIAGVFARQTGNTRLAARTVRAVLALPRVQRHELSHPLADRAAALAARCKLRGADAVYAALAEALEAPLITLDQEILERAKRIVRTLTPGEWLRNNA